MPGRADRGPYRPPRSPLRGCACGASMGAGLPEPAAGAGAIPAAELEPVGALLQRLATRGPHGAPLSPMRPGITFPTALHPLQHPPLCFPEANSAAASGGWTQARSEWVWLAQRPPQPSRRGERPGGERAKRSRWTRQGRGLRVQQN